MPPTRKLNGPSRSLDNMASADQLLLYWFDRSNWSDWSLQILLPPKLTYTLSSAREVQSWPFGTSGMIAAATGPTYALDRIGHVGPTPSGMGSAAKTARVISPLE